MDERTNKFIAELYLSGKTARDYCNWAIESLEMGFDSKNLRILSSMLQNYYAYETETYFRKSLVDLNWQFPAENDCLKRYGKLLSEKVLNDEINPFDALSILQEIYYNSHYNDDFQNWGYLYMHEDSMSEEEFIEAIKKEADNFLRDGRVKFPETMEEKQLFSDIRQNESFIDKLLKIFS